MTYARCFAVGRVLVAATCGSILGGFLAFASAQVSSPGQVDTACASNCTAHGYDAEFCNQVCWIPDPATAAKGENLDWKCMTACRERGGGAEECMSSCRRR